MLEDGVIEDGVRPSFFLRARKLLIERDFGTTLPFHFGFDRFFELNEGLTPFLTPSLTCQGMEY